MDIIDLVLIGSHGVELDRVNVEVEDKENCTDTVLAVLDVAKWVLSVGDRIEIQSATHNADGTRKYRCVNGVVE